MSRTGIIFRGVALIIGAVIVAFNVLLYLFCEKQKTALDVIQNQQQIEAKLNTNQFKYQQEQIEHLSKDLDDARQQIKDQRDALVSQNDVNKGIQTSLVDIKAEADAIKEDMKGWQKDYVTVLADLDKKMDDSQDHIKSVEDNLTNLNIPELKEDIKTLKTDIEKMSQPSDNSVHEDQDQALPDKTKPEGPA